MKVAVLVFINGGFKRAYPVESDHVLAFENGLDEGASYFGGDFFTAIYPPSGDRNRRADFEEFVPDCQERAIGLWAGDKAISAGASVGRTDAGFPNG